MGGACHGTGIPKADCPLIQLFDLPGRMGRGMSKVKPEKVGLSSKRLERLTHAMQKGVEAGHFSGAVAAITRKGKIAYFEAYGHQDLKAAVPMGEDAIFRIASMTKAITGVAAMIRYGEGHFFLNDPVERLLPAVYGPVNWVANLAGM